MLVLPRSYRTLEQLAAAERLTARYAPYLMWADQSVLNLWLARNRLSPVRDFRFNYQVRLLLERRELAVFRDAKILHFNGQLGEPPFLLALSYCILSVVPCGRQLLPTAIRLSRWPGFYRLPWYRLRPVLRRLLMNWVLNPAR